MGEMVKETPADETTGTARFTASFSLSMTEAQYAELQALAAEHGVSMSRVARRALRTGLTVLRKTPRLAAEFAQPEQE